MGGEATLEQLWPELGSSAAIVSFVVGLFFMFGGMVIVFVEVWRSLNVVTDEHERLESLGTDSTQHEAL